MCFGVAFPRLEWTLDACLVVHGSGNAWTGESISAFPGEEEFFGSRISFGLYGPEPSAFILRKLEG